MACIPIVSYSDSNDSKPDFTSYRFVKTTFKNGFIMPEGYTYWHSNRIKNNLEELI